MPSVEFVDGKWISVSSIRATDLDAGKAVSAPETKPTPAPVEAPKATKTTTPKKTDA
jgi:hypothetical protein